MRGNQSRKLALPIISHKFLFNGIWLSLFAGSCICDDNLAGCGIRHGFNNLVWGLWSTKTCQNVCISIHQFSLKHANCNFYDWVSRFRTRDNAVLVATDVAARGLDIKGVQHVIHYQLPRTVEVCAINPR
jgi:hypothetical protein